MTIALRNLLAILFLVVSIPLGTLATLASRPYKVLVISSSSGPPECLEAMKTTWYGFPIPWFFTHESKLLEGNCFVNLAPFSEFVPGAFLLDVLIYMALCYASILAYVRIRRVVYARMR